CRTRRVRESRHQGGPPAGTPPAIPRVDRPGRRSSGVFKLPREPLPQGPLGPGDVLTRNGSQARPRYEPSAVLTLSSSPYLMNSGTCTTGPVSIFAGFCTLLAVSPRIPSADSTTLSVNDEGRLT